MPIFNRHDASAGCRRGLARSEGEDAPILRRPDRGVIFGVCWQSAAPAALFQRLAPDPKDISSLNSPRCPPESGTGVFSLLTSTSASGRESQRDSGPKPRVARHENGNPSRGLRKIRKGLRMMGGIMGGEQGGCNREEKVVQTDLQRITTP